MLKGQGIWVLEREMVGATRPGEAEGAQKGQRLLEEWVPWAHFEFKLSGVHAGRDIQQAGVYGGPVLR